MSDEYDTTEKIEETETGYRLTVSCKRGTGTRDQDKVKATAKAETLEDLLRDRPEVVDAVKQSMFETRRIRPDEEDGGSE